MKTCAIDSSSKNIGFSIFHQSSLVEYGNVAIRKLTHHDVFDITFHKEGRKFSGETAKENIVVVHAINAFIMRLKELHPDITHFVMDDYFFGLEQKTLAQLAEINGCLCSYIYQKYGLKVHKYAPNNKHHALGVVDNTHKPHGMRWTKEQKRKAEVERKQKLIDAVRLLYKLPADITHDEADSIGLNHFFISHFKAQSLERYSGTAVFYSGIKAKKGKKREKKVLFE